MNSADKMNERTTFLFQAIVNITSLVQLSDTKISIIVAANMGILAIFLSILKDYVLVIKNTECYFFIISMILFVLFMLSWLISIIYSIKAIKSRIAKSEYISSWFIDTNILDCKTYIKQIKKMKDIDLENNLANELYKLNSIHNKKIDNVNIALYLFLNEILILFLILLLTIFNL